MQLIYQVTVITPEGEDEHNFMIVVGRDGRVIGRTDKPMIHALSEMVSIIATDIEEAAEN
jgi:hypothetical protein